MPPTSSRPMIPSTKMHSKHHQNHHHTMATTYKPHYSTYPHPSTRHNPTWPETQANIILSLRDVSNPPAKTPDADVQGLDAELQIHARWTDPDLVEALVRISLPTQSRMRRGTLTRQDSPTPPGATAAIPSTKSQTIPPIRRSRRHGRDVDHRA